MIHIRAERAVERNQDACPLLPERTSMLTTGSIEYVPYAIDAMNLWSPDLTRIPVAVIA